MLKHRIIPTLLWNGFGLVKGSVFQATRNIGPVVPAIEVFKKRDVDELVIMDIDQSKCNLTEPDVLSIADFVENCNVPLAYGGGISTIESARALLSAGVDKIIINTHQYTKPTLISELAERFGSQAVVCAIDARKNAQSTFTAYSHCGQKNESLDPLKIASQAERLGAGEILLTSIDHEGLMAGYDIELTQLITESINIPVIASGGAGNPQHCIDVVAQGGASAVAIGSAFFYTELTPDDIRFAFKKVKLPVRTVL